MTFIEQVENAIKKNHLKLTVEVARLIIKRSSGKSNPPASPAQDLETIKSKHKKKRKTGVKRRKKK